MNLTSSNGMDSLIGKRVPNARIACNNDATGLREMTKGFPYLLLFTGKRPSIEMAQSTYDLYDSMLTDYRTMVKTTIVTDLVPMRLKDREIVLDLDGTLYEVFSVGDHPLLVLIDKHQSIRCISDQISVEQVALMLSEHSDIM
ncbi:MAG: hypothetical protein AAF348_03140 [Bacteroidota bacterium]